MLKSSSAPLCDFFPRGRSCRGNADQQLRLNISSIALLIKDLELLRGQLQGVLGRQIVVTRILSVPLEWHTCLE